MGRSNVFVAHFKHSLENKDNVDISNIDLLFTNFSLLPAAAIFRKIYGKNQQHFWHSIIENNKHTDILEKLLSERENRLKESLGKGCWLV